MSFESFSESHHHLSHNFVDIHNTDEGRDLESGISDDSIPNAGTANDVDTSISDEAP